MLFWAIIATLIIVTDQIFKVLVMQNIGLTDSIQVIKGLFEFVYVKNTGAAFSIFENMTFALGIISILFCIFVIVYWINKKPTSKLLCTAITLLFGGALGNAIDRVFRHYVVDFIKVSFINFPVFNIADIAITIGAILLIVYIIWFDKEKEEKN